MAFIPVVNTTKSVVGMTLFNVPISNTLWFNWAEAPDPGDALALNDAIIIGWEDHILPIQSNALEMMQVQTYDMSSADSWVMTTPFDASTVGGNATTPGLPANIACVVSFRTENRGKSGRGRLYHAGLTEAQVTGNQLTTTVPGTIRQNYINMFADIESAAGVNHVIVSFQGGGVARLTGWVQQVHQYIVNERIDTQRRRLGD